MSPTSMRLSAIEVHGIDALLPGQLELESRLNANANENKNENEKVSRTDVIIYVKLVFIPFSFGLVPKARSSGNNS